MVKKNKGQAHMRQKNNVVLLKSTRHARKLRPAFGVFGVVHRQKVISADVLPFPLDRGNNRSPVLVRNATSLLPLHGAPMTDTNIRSHISHGLPTVEQGFKGLHQSFISRDGLSPQDGSIFPVTAIERLGTIRPMGRALTPVKFNRKLADLLQAARKSAGYTNQKEFAEDLGVSWERYKKWESGRTPIQHEYIPRACELLGKDANYFYQTPAVESHKGKRHEKGTDRDIRHANP